MALNTQTIEDGDRYAVVKHVATAETAAAATVTINPANFAGVNGRPGAFGEFKIEALWCITDTPITLEWEATSNVLAYVVVDSEEKKFEVIGGLPNNAGAGKTGSIIVTPTADNANFTLIAKLSKQE